MSAWAIVALGCGGKFDGPGYGMTISDSHGPECCAQQLIAKVGGDVTPVAQGPVYACEAMGYTFELLEKCLEDWGLDGHCQPDT
jgi:hypothetical protein